jgi:hypothetical protein
MTWYHPKYYKELRKQYRDSIEALPRNGESLVPASSSKRQASSNTKPEPSSGSETSNYKHQASSSKHQA